MLLAVLLSIAVGTYALRLAGPLLHRRGMLPAGARAFLGDAAVVLLLALAATSAITQSGGFAGWARVLGVLVGAALIIARMPLALVLFAAVGVTAALRFWGLA